MAARKTKAAKKSRAPRTPKDGVNKVEFVRSLPPGTSWADAEAKAKAAGIVLSKAYYYVIKSGLKKAGVGAAKRKPGRKPGRTPGRGGAGELMLTSSNKDEAAFIESARRLGVARARTVLDALAKFER